MSFWFKGWDGYTTVQMAQRIMSPCQTFVDVGCGIAPCVYMLAARHVCVEPHEEYWPLAIEHAERPIEILKGTWKEKRDEVIALKPDVIMAIDVIEHMSREEGEVFKKDLQEIPLFGSAVFTPWGFQEQSYKDGEKDAWGYNGQHWQTHRSGWLPEDFPGWHILKSRGEKVPGEWIETLTAFYDKAGIFERPFAQITLGRPT